MHRPAHDRIRGQLPLPDKLFYKIGEISRISGIEPYVLRYWETEFQFLKPRKNRSGQRVYVKKDLETILQIKKMLYQERYTIEGVRKRFEEGVVAPSQPKLLPEAPVRETGNPAEVLAFVKRRLKDILSQMR